MPMSSEPGVAPPGMIPLCVPEIRGNEWRYIKDCLDTGWVSSVGTYVDRFEKEIAHYVGTKRAVATINGTSALHVALIVAGVQPNDEVLVPTLTFIAPANAVRYVGAWPVFIDADPRYWQMDASKLADFLKRKCRRNKGRLYNNTTGRRICAILPVHVLGHPVDLDPILELAHQYDLRVVEDATESLGAEYKGRRVGRWGSMSCFSFNGNKLVTTGGGGMITTDNGAWADKAKYLTTQAKDDPLEYVHNEIGYNHRLSNVQAAMGCAQLERVADFIAAKRRIASRYQEAFAGISGLSVMQEAPWAFSVFWMFTILVDAVVLGVNSRQLLRRLAKRRIQTRPLWQPLHRSPAHRGAQAFQCEVADRLYDSGLSLPCSVGLKEQDQRRVISEIKTLLHLR